MEYDLASGFEREPMTASSQAAVIDACLSTDRMSDMISRFSNSIGFRRYHKAAASHEVEIAEAAVTKFLVSGSEFFAADHIESTLDKVEELAELVDSIRSADFFDALVRATVATVRDKFPHASPEQLDHMTSERVLDQAIKFAHEADTSRAMDVLKGVDFVFCYVPGLDAAETLEETMTRHWSDESGSLTIKPDTVFARFLRLAGVTRDQWLEAVFEACGVDLREDPPAGAPAWMWERAEAWRKFNPPVEAGRKPVTEVVQLVEAVDNVPGGFTPSIAFATDAYSFVTRDWTRPMVVKGGVIGLSDLIQGSGDPIRFEGTAVISGEREDFVLSANMPNPPEKTYGLHQSAFKSKISDGKGMRVASDETRWSVFADRSVA